ncbi:MAG: hypothetical protein MI974_01370 [Chitinophagales bacterium]|nr:hypothetical protein [Chitinophagales bacterium]
MKDENIQSGSENNNILHEGEAAFYLSVWLGAVFIYIIHLGSRPFDFFYQDKFKYRNAFIGWTLQLLIVVGLFLIPILFF